MIHFHGCDHFFFPPKLHNDVYGTEEQISHAPPALQPGYTAVMYGFLVTASS